MAKAPARLTHGVGLTLARGDVALVLQLDNLFNQTTATTVLDEGPPRLTGKTPQSDFLGYPLPGRRGSLTLKFTR